MVQCSSWNPLHILHPEHEQIRADYYRLLLEVSRLMIGSSCGLDGAEWLPLGPCGTLWDLVGPCGTLWDLVGPCGTLWDLW